MIVRAGILLAVLLGGIVAGGLARRVGSRDGSPAAGHAVGDLPAGLVLVSAPYCHACQRLREAIAALQPGLAYSEVDVVRRPDVVRALGIRSAPTLLVLDGDGHVDARLHGGHTIDELRDFLALHGATEYASDHLRPGTDQRSP